MEFLQKLENKLADIYKGAPQLPANAKETLAEIWPWLALVAGIVQLFAAWGLWQLIHVISALDAWAHSMGRYYGTYNTGPSMADRTMVYIGILVLVLDAVILLMAFPKLKLRQKAGWNLLFLAAVVNVGYGVVQVFIDGRGFGSLIFSILQSIVVLYFLFQVRDKFAATAGVKPVSEAPAQPEVKEVTAEAKPKATSYPAHKDAKNTEEKPTKHKH